MLYRKSSYAPDDELYLYNLCYYFKVITIAKI